MGCRKKRRADCSSVKDHSGYSPSSRRAPGQNSQQRRYTSLRLGALARIRKTSASSSDNNYGD